jgi:hypothetical protein
VDDDPLDDMLRDDPGNVIGTVVSKSVANPWRDTKIAVLAGQKAVKNGFANCVVNRRRIYFYLLE